MFKICNFLDKTLVDLNGGNHRMKDTVHWSIMIFPTFQMLNLTYF